MNKPHLAIENVVKRFGGVTALDHCTLSVKQGSITALIGPNGSGKTTLFDAISQLVPADSGTITFNGIELTALHHRPDTVANTGIARTFQDVRLFRHLTIRQHFLLAQDHQDSNLFTNILCSQNEKVHDAKFSKALARVQLAKPLDTVVIDLSYGQRKLLDIAIAIVKPHALLMLDEPVAGVNPKLREVIKRVLIDLRKQGETILLIEHDMNFTMTLADYVWVLDAGKVIAQGTATQVRKNPLVLAAYLGDSK